MNLWKSYENKKDIHNLYFEPMNIMKKNMEIMPAGEKLEKDGEKKPVDLKPSKETLEEHEKAAKTMKEMGAEHKELEQKDQEKLEKQYGEQLLRLDFLGRADNFEKEFKGVNIEVSGEKYTLNFSSLLKDGKKVEKGDMKDLKKDVDEKGLNLDRISGNFDLVAIKGRENLNLSYNLSIKRILTCQTPAMLARLITETFAGTDDHYRKAGQRPVAPKEQPGVVEKKQEKINEVKKTAEARGGEVSILEGKGITSLVVRFRNEKQIHLTSSDMAVWSYAEVENGKISRSGSTSSPQEVLPNEEPSGSE